MTPNEPINTTPVRAEARAGLGAARATSTICLLAGIWLFVSPWVYGAWLKGDAWNCWIVGGFMVLFGIVRMALPAYSTVLSWCNMILGIWTFCSPWIFGYTGNSGRFINSLCLGVIVFVFSIASARISGTRNAAPLSGPYVAGGTNSPGTTR